jgi:hypothetical protein
MTSLILMSHCMSTCIQSPALAIGHSGNNESNLLKASIDIQSIYLLSLCRSTALAQ